MSPGKLASQAGHAFLDSYVKTLSIDKERCDEYSKDSHGTKVTLISDNLDHLIVAKEIAEQNNIPVSLIVDSGHIMLPHFTGEPIVTALGIGPCYRDEVKQITKRFKLA